MLPLLAFAPHPLFRLLLLIATAAFVACVVVARMRRRDALNDRLKSLEDKLDRLAPK